MYGDAGDALVSTRLAECAGVKPSATTLIRMNPFRWSRSVPLNVCVSQLRNPARVETKRPVDLMINGAVREFAVQQSAIDYLVAIENLLSVRKQLVCCDQQPETLESLADDAKRQCMELFTDGEQMYTRALQERGSTLCEKIHTAIDALCHLAPTDPFAFDGILFKAPAC